MPRRNKQSGAVLICVSIMLLIGRWVDLLVMIGPSQGETLAAPGLSEAGIAAGMVGVIGLCVFWSLAQLPLVPQGAADVLTEHRPNTAPAAE
jgi:hypothetical protein